VQRISQPQLTEQLSKTTPMRKKKIKKGAKREKERLKK
jgi:hypothetical protein